GVSIVSRANQRDLSQTPRSDDLPGFDLRRRADVLAADLQNAPGLFDRRDNLHAFINRVGERLFDINILAGFERRDGVLFVQVIRRADVDGVDARRGQQFVVVFVGFRASLGNLDGMPETPFVRVAERDDLETRNLQYLAEDLVRARAGPDETQGDAIIRAVGVVERGFGTAAHPPRQPGSPARRRAALAEFPAIDSV